MSHGQACNKSPPIIFFDSDSHINPDVKSHLRASFLRRYAVSISPKYAVVCVPLTTVILKVSRVAK